MDRNTILLFAGIGAVLLLATLIARYLRHRAGDGPNAVTSMRASMPGGPWCW
jgi:phosphatidate cytidylyltransferase